MKISKTKRTSDLNNEQLVCNIVNELIHNETLLTSFLNESVNFFVIPKYKSTEELKKSLRKELRKTTIGSNRFIGCLANVYKKMLKEGKNIEILNSIMIPSDFCLELLIWYPELIKYFPENFSIEVCSNKKVISLLFSNTIKDSGIKGAINLISLFKNVSGSENIFNNHTMIYSIFLDIYYLSDKRYEEFELQELYDTLLPYLNTSYKSMLIYNKLFTK